MLQTALRFLVVMVLMFWQGGFLFYVSVVVPTGTEVLRSALRQGFITRQVTGWLNVSALVALGVLLLEVLLQRDAARWRFWGRVGLWAFMAACQAVLHVLHGWMDELLVPRGMIVTDPEAFHPMHRVYLWAHTLQWAAGLVYVWWTLAAWRAADRAEWQRPGDGSLA